MNNNPVSCKESFESSFRCIENSTGSSNDPMQNSQAMRNTRLPRNRPVSPNYADEQISLPLEIVESFGHLESNEWDLVVD